LEELLRESALLPEEVRWFHGVTDETLAALYRGARVFVLPTLWEGFGLPVLEAMACGCPMAISRAGALAELVCEEEGAAEIPMGVLLDPEAPPDAWARAIGGIFDAPHERRMAMSRAARRRAERFTWAAAARATLDVYREAAAARSNLP